MAHGKDGQGTGGGILLCLYIFLPQGQSQSWFSILGLILAAIPWIVWFLIYLYHCFRPIVISSSSNNNNNNAQSLFHGKPKLSSTHEAAATAIESPSARGGGQGSSFRSSVGGLDGGDGERHVHFGDVVVVDGGSSGCQTQNSSGEILMNESFSRKETTGGIIETEMPLNSSTSKS
ncbi:putative transmembrane protein [Senna tora]|uniref:Putative transmembrane protein n=1 Tax=Senna tora TaxID=362788 RepID=A0A834XIB2_9FABA|nr:putative transmembrane protein [Senna tora]